MTRMTRQILTAAIATVAMAQIGNQPPTPVPTTAPAQPTTAQQLQLALAEVGRLRAELAACNTGREFRDSLHKQAEAETVAEEAKVQVRRALGLADTCQPSITGTEVRFVCQ